MRHLILALFAVLLLIPARAFAADLGGIGESCRARSDCRSGLKCIAQACTDEREGAQCFTNGDCGGELACVQNYCTRRASPMSWHPTASTAPQAEQVEPKPSFALEGVHPFFGVTTAGGPTSLGVANDQNFVLDPTVQGSFIFALRGGVMFGRNELGVEVSPGTYAYYSNTGGGAFQFNVTYAHYLPIHEGRSVSVYWPLRAGVGMFTGHTDDMAFFQARADLFGVALRFGHVMVDMHVPSFRYGLSNTNYEGKYSHGTASVHLFSWEVGTSVTYLF
jgi:hypothetical protein